MKIVVMTTTNCVDYKKKLYFNGDIIDMPDKYATPLIDKGVCEEVIAETPALSEMTVAALKELLDKLKISYNAKDTKVKLISLVEFHTAEAEEKE